MTLRRVLVGLALKKQRYRAALISLTRNYQVERVSGPDRIEVVLLGGAPSRPPLVTAVATCHHAPPTLLGGCLDRHRKIDEISQFRPR